jgi:hypothetical protein
MKKAKSLYHGHRLPAAVISRAVRHRFTGITQDPSDF